MLATSLILSIYLGKLDKLSRVGVTPGGLSLPTSESFPEGTDETQTLGAIQLSDHLGPEGGGGGGVHPYVFLD